MGGGDAGFPIRIENSIIANNAGMAIALSGSHEEPSQIINNVIYNNSGGINVSSPALILNNIISGNSGIGIISGNSSPEISFNNMWDNQGGNYQGCLPGIGDISLDPLFVDPDNGDYHLQQNSPSRGVGKDGVDMGAYPGGIIPVVENELPTEFSLQNYPNPFNSSTLIKYQLPENTKVSLDVYNVSGQKIITLVDKIKSKGLHQVNFDAIDLSSGIYFYQLRTQNTIKTNKMLLVK